MGEDGRHDLGHDHWYHEVWGLIGEEERVTGITVYHPLDPTPGDPDALTECGGYVAFARDAGDAKPTWSVVQPDPLTLEPSILCREHGDHGWIRGGRWVPA